jgi:hypothetical protein
VELADLEKLVIQKDATRLTEYAKNAATMKVNQQSFSNVQAYAPSSYHGAFQVLDNLKHHRHN